MTSWHRGRYALVHIGEHVACRIVFNRFHETYGGTPEPLVVPRGRLPSDRDLEIVHESLGRVCRRV